MLHAEGVFTGKDGISLYYQSWRSVETPKAVLGVLHGLGGHSGLFNNIVKTIVPQGYGVYGMDLRGHGRSDGQRGYVNRWTEFREDFDSFWQLLATQCPSLPRFVLGHSLGSIIVLDYALQYPESFSGLVVMAPPFKPVGVPPFRLAIGQLLSWVYPRFTLNTGIPQTAISRDPEVVAAYVNDPLRHTRGTARLVTEYLQTVQRIQANLHRLQTPILLLHGGADAIALSEGSRLLFEQLKVVDKEYRFYPEAFHDLFNDINYERVIHDLLNWLDRHIEGNLNLCQLDDRLNIYI